MPTVESLTKMQLEYASALVCDLKKRGEEYSAAIVAQLISREEALQNAGLPLLRQQHGGCVMALKVGDRVKVKPGKEHDSMTKGKTGTVKEVSTPALGIKFDDMASVHKWYVEDELDKQ